MLTQNQLQAIDEYFLAKSLYGFALARYMAKENIKESYDHYLVKTKKLDFLDEYY